MAATQEKPGGWFHNKIVRGGAIAVGLISLFIAVGVGMNKFLRDEDISASAIAAEADGHVQAARETYDGNYQFIISQVGADCVGAMVKVVARDYAEELEMAFDENGIKNELYTKEFAAELIAADCPNAGKLPDLYKNFRHAVQPLEDAILGGYLDDGNMDEQDYVHLRDSEISLLTILYNE